MKLRVLFTEQRAVSSVISTVLMVAVVIVLAAVIGGFAFDLSGTLNPNAPKAGFQVTYDVASNGANNTTTIALASGNEIETKRLYVNIGGETAWNGTGGAAPDYTASGDWSGKKISSGDSITIEEKNVGTITTGEQVGIYWRSADKSTILTKQRITA